MEQLFLIIVKQKDLPAGSHPIIHDDDGEVRNSTTNEKHTVLGPDLERIKNLKAARPEAKLELPENIYLAKKDIDDRITRLKAIAKMHKDLNPMCLRKDQFDNILKQIIDIRHLFVHYSIHPPFKDIRKNWNDGPRIEEQEKYSTFLYIFHFK